MHYVIIENKREDKKKRKIFVQMSKSTQDPLSYDTDLLNFVSYGNPIYIRFYYIKRTLIHSDTFINFIWKK